jgi:hypothetical protein
MFACPKARRAGLEPRTRRVYTKTRFGRCVSCFGDHTERENIDFLLQEVASAERSSVGAKLASVFSPLAGFCDGVRSKYSADVQTQQIAALSASRTAGISTKLDGVPGPSPSRIPWHCCAPAVENQQGHPRRCLIEPSCRPKIFVSCDLKTSFSKSKTFGSVS